MNIRNISLLFDISALNRCLSYEKCDSCVFFNNNIDDCAVALWGDADIADKCDEKLIGILADYCSTRYSEDGCMLNTNKGCISTIMTHQTSRRKRAILWA